MRHSAALTSRLSVTGYDRLRVFVCGAAVGFGQAPFDLPAVSVPALAALIVMVLGAATTPRRAAVLGWFAGFGYFVLTLHWIVDPFFVDAAHDAWMAPFGLLSLTGGLALFWGAAFGLAAWLAPEGGMLHRSLALTASFTATEMLRAVLFTGFPWAMPGTIWVETPMRMLAAWIGPHGLNLLTLLIAGLLAAAWSAAGRARVLALAAAAVLVAGGLGLGIRMLSKIPAEAPPGAPVLRLVQPDAAQNLKWRADMVAVFWQRQLALSASPDGAAPDLVIWPEVALPYLLGQRPDLDTEIVTTAHAPVMAGAQRFDGERLMNSLVVFGRDGAVDAVYDKHHLVPFGEYVPGGALIADLGIAGLATDELGGFSPGPGPRVLDLTRIGLGHVLPLICYEAIFPRHARVPGERPDWIVQITNDSWFGDFAGPQQHLAQARMRAVEQGLPLVRVAQTGISALIDPAGRIVASLPMETAGALDVALPAPRAATLYARVAGAPVHVLLALAVLGLLAVRRRGG